MDFCHLFQSTSGKRIVMQIEIDVLPFLSVNILDLRDSGFQRIREVRGVFRTYCRSLIVLKSKDVNRTMS